MIRRFATTCVMLVLCTAAAASQPNLSVDIYIPQITVNTTTQQYDPMPIPVVVTVHNTGTAASQPLSARITFPPLLELDASEMHQTIKMTIPPTVPPNDSSKIVWMLYHQPSFKTVNYRVSVWLKTSPTDSFVTNKLFILPAMSRADLAVTIRPLPPLQVRPDSLGYADNPFNLFSRVVNNGGTQADSVRVYLKLPPDYMLDPPTQENPVHVPQPIPGAGSATQRYEYDWDIRYLGATRQQRNDTLAVIVSGIDLAGDTTKGDTTAILIVDGMAPPCVVQLSAPAALAYDADSIYSPNPFMVKVRVENIGEQHAVLKRLQVQDAGDGISTNDPQTVPLPTLLPGDVFNYSLRFLATRSDTNRSVLFTGIVVDLDNGTISDDATTMIPGEPYGIRIVNVLIPDTLHTDAGGTDYLLNPFPVSFDVQNDSWFVSTITQAQLAGPSSGLVPPVVRQYTPALQLSPGADGNVVRDTMEIIGSTNDRVMTFRFMAISDMGDTARSSRDMFVPGLVPVSSISRNGADSLRYDPFRSYIPNPFYESITLRNDGHIPFRADSIVIRFSMDGVSPAEPLRQDFGWGVAPGDSITARWNLTAYERSYDRTVHFLATAYYEGRFFADIDFDVFIPGLYPVLDATLAGADTLVYDPVTTYRPNPFEKRLLLRNTGTADILIDSVVLAYSDTLVQAMDALRRDVAQALEPDSSLTVRWRFTAMRRDAETRIPFTVTVFHDSGSTVLNSHVFIPALTPGLDVRVEGPDSLQFDTATIYSPSPFERTLVVHNTGTAPLEIDSAQLASLGGGLSSLDPWKRPFSKTLPPGAEASIAWRFTAERRTNSARLPFTFVLYHSGGQALTLGSEVFVPGQQFGFRLSGVIVPDTLHLTDSRGDYKKNPFLTRFSAFNDTWTRVTSHRSVIWLEGDGVTPLTQLDRTSSATIEPWASSAIRSDSFKVQARSVDRTLRLHFQVRDNIGAGDSAIYEIFVPAVEITSVKNPYTPEQLRITAVYPNPVLRTSDRVTIEYTLDAPATVQIEVLDLLGRTVESRRLTETQSGARTATFQLPALRPGVYILRIRNSVTTAAIRIAVMK